MTDYKQGLSGHGGGSGKYSYRHASIGGSTAKVSHMPEDLFTVRIVFEAQGRETHPTVLINDSMAHCLWAALNEMAKDLGWSDQLTIDLLKDKK